MPIDLEPQGPAEHKFMLMMHDRLVKLELECDARDKANALLEERVKALDERVKELELKTYEAGGDTFSDGGHMDWFLFEPLDSACVGYEDRPPRKLSASHWDALVQLPVPPTFPPRPKIMAPVSRFRDVKRELSIPDRHDLTVRDLFGAIRAFYNDVPVTMEDLVDHDEDEDYYLDAVKKLEMGKPVRWVDLLGRDGYLSGGTGLEDRRHPLSCSGCVRYEGIEATLRHATPRHLEIVLGS